MTFPNLPFTILTAEDDPDDRILVADAFTESGLENKLVFVQDGLELLRYLRHQDIYANHDTAPRPDLILLDLNMPRLDGRASLAEIKSDPELRCIPVVVLTNSDIEEDILHTYEHGGAGFILKPDNFQSMVDIVKGLHEYWFDVVELIDGDYKKSSRKSDPGYRL